MKDISKLLIAEPPLMILRSLAVAVGLNEAIVLQQLYWLLRDPENGKKLDEKQWIFNTYEQWRVSFFPFWSEDTIKRAFTTLAKLNLIETCQPEGVLSRRKYYRVNEEQLQWISEQGKLPSSTVQVAPFVSANCPLPITKKTSAKKTLKKDKGCLREELSNNGVLKVPYPATEDQMQETLEAYGITPNLEYDGGFFQAMTRSGWKIRGKPIFDWIATYQARLEVTDPALR